MMEMTIFNDGTVNLHAENGFTEYFASTTD